MKMDLKEMRYVSVDRIDLAQNMVGCCENGNEPSGPIRYKDTIAWRYECMDLCRYDIKKSRLKKTWMKAKLNGRGDNDDDDDDDDDDDEAYSMTRANCKTNIQVQNAVITSVNL